MRKRLLIALATLVVLAGCASSGYEVNRTGLGDPPDCVVIDHYRPSGDIWGDIKVDGHWTFCRNKP